MVLAYSNQRRLSATANKRRGVEVRATVDRMKETPCADCGCTYPSFVMDFDHLDPSSKSFEISQHLTHKPWTVVLAEIAKCEVVCANCHRLRSWNPPKRLSARQQLIIDLKTVDCADCRGRFHYSQMDFDHRQGGKVRQVPKMGSHQAIREEAAKCDIVCANCHRFRTQVSKKGNARTSPADVDMVWKHRSAASPQTCLRDDGRPAERSWHTLAGTMPDGILASQHGITRCAVRKYRGRVGIRPFTPQGVKPEYREVPCVA